MQELLHKYGKGIPVIMIGMMLVLALAVTLTAGAKPGSSKEPTSSELPNKQGKGNVSQLLGVVKDINTEVNSITIMGIEDNKENILYFNGGTDISNQYGRILSMMQINLGEIVDAYYQSDDNKLIKMQISKDAWEYKGVGNLKINSSTKVMEIADTKYQFTENLIIANNGELAALIDINDKDELTVKGVGKKILSLLVTRGHGYIRLVNYDAFVEGTVEVGYDIFLPVTEDMLIVAREGSYKITLENGKLKGSKQINVVRDRELLVDMSEYKKDAVQVSSVDFLIEPFGAMLYIDGKETDYADSVTLTYGKHAIKVSLGGYKTYSGTLFVNESSMQIPINLADTNSSNKKEENSTNNSSKIEEEEDDQIEDSNVIGKTPDGSDITLEEDDEEPEEGQEEETPPENNNPENESRVDSNHKIIIDSPVGAEVYLDGNLKGTAPCSFTKQTGSHTISFRKSGYETKSYSIEVPDNDENTTWSFPDMAPLN